MNRYFSRDLKRLRPCYPVRFRDVLFGIVLGGLVVAILARTL